MKGVLYHNRVGLVYPAQKHLSGGHGVIGVDVRHSVGEEQDEDSNNVMEITVLVSAR